MTNDSRQAAIVRRWCGAVTAGDLDTVRDLVRESVEFHGPRGICSGADLVVDWVQHSGIHIMPLKLRDEGATVVAECNVRRHGRSTTVRESPPKRKRLPWCWSSGLWMGGSRPSGGSMSQQPGLSVGKGRSRRATGPSPPPPGDASAHVPDCHILQWSSNDDSGSGWCRERSFRSRRSRTPESDWFGPRRAVLQPSA